MVALLATCLATASGGLQVTASAAPPLPTCRESAGLDYSGKAATGTVRVWTTTCGTAREVGTLRFRGTMTACNALGCRTSHSSATCAYRRKICTFSTSLAHPSVDVASYEFDYSYQGNGRDVVGSNGTVLADCADAVALQACP